MISSFILKSIHMLYLEVLKERPENGLWQASEKLSINEEKSKNDVDRFADLLRISLAPVALPCHKANSPKPWLRRHTTLAR